MTTQKIFGLKLLERLNIAAIVIYPFMLFADDEASVSDRLMRHELTHVDQVRRVGWLCFYLSYGLEYLANLLKYKNHADAYWFISYEIEARGAEQDA